MRNYIIKITPCWRDSYLLIVEFISITQGMWFLYIAYIHMYLYTYVYIHISMYWEGIIVLFWTVLSLRVRWFVLHTCTRMIIHLVFPLALKPSLHLDIDRYITRVTMYAVFYAKPIINRYCQLSSLFYIDGLCVSTARNGLPFSMSTRFSKQR